MAASNGTKMNTETKLTPEQSAEWQYYVRWYGNNGWEGEEGRRLAWQDLCESAAAILGHITPRKRDAAEGN